MARKTLPAGWTITTRSITYSAAAPADIAGTTGTLYCGVKDGHEYICAHSREDAVRLIEERAAYERPVRVWFEDGSARVLPQGLAPNVRGLDFLGNVVVENEYIGLYPLTPCCNASGKGGEYGVMCRSCYDDVDDYFGGSAEVAIKVLAKR